MSAEDWPKIRRFITLQENEDLEDEEEAELNEFSAEQVVVAFARGSKDVDRDTDLLTMTTYFGNLFFGEPDDMVTAVSKALNIVLTERDQRFVIDNIKDLINYLGQDTEEYFKSQVFEEVEAELLDLRPELKMWFISEDWLYGAFNIRGLLTEAVQNSDTYALDRLARDDVSETITKFAAGTTREEREETAKLVYKYIMLVGWSNPVDAMGLSLDYILHIKGVVPAPMIDNLIELLKCFSKGPSGSERNVEVIRQIRARVDSELLKGCVELNAWFIEYLGADARNATSSSGASGSGAAGSAMDTDRPQPSSIGGGGGAAAPPPEKMTVPPYQIAPKKPKKPKVYDDPDSILENKLVKPKDGSAGSPATVESFVETHKDLFRRPGQWRGLFTYLCGRSPEKRVETLAQSPRLVRALFAAIMNADEQLCPPDTTNGMRTLWKILWDKYVARDIGPFLAEFASETVNLVIINMERIKKEAKKLGDPADDSVNSKQVVRKTVYDIVHSITTVVGVNRFVDLILEFQRFRQKYPISLPSTTHGNAGLNMALNSILDALKYQSDKTLYNAVVTQLTNMYENRLSEIEDALGPIKDSSVFTTVADKNPRLSDLLEGVRRDRKASRGASSNFVDVSSDAPEARIIKSLDDLLTPAIPKPEYMIVHEVPRLYMELLDIPSITVEQFVGYIDRYGRAMDLLRVSTDLVNKLLSTRGNEIFQTPATLSPSVMKKIILNFILDYDVFKQHALRLDLRVVDDVGFGTKWYKEMDKLKRRNRSRIILFQMIMPLHQHSHIFAEMVKAEYNKEYQGSEQQRIVLNDMREFTDRHMEYFVLRPNIVLGTEHAYMANIIDRRRVAFEIVMRELRDKPSWSSVNHRLVTDLARFINPIQRFVDGQERNFSSQEELVRRREKVADAIRSRDDPEAPAAFLDAIGAVETEIFDKRIRQALATYRAHKKMPRIEGGGGAAGGGGGDDDDDAHTHRKVPGGGIVPRARARW